MGLNEALAAALKNLPSTARATTLADEGVRSSQVDGYKLKEGQTDRVAIIDPNLVVVGRQHFGGEGVGYVLCKSVYKMEGQVEVLDRKALCCTHMGEPKLRIVTPIVRYTTKPTGEVIAPLTLEYFTWRIGPEMFGQLRATHKEWDLSQHDLLLTCEDEKFQRINITIAKERVISAPQIKEKFDAEIGAFITGVVPKMTKAIGNELTDDQLLQKLGRGAAVVGAAAAARVSDSPIGNIDDLLGK